MIYYTPVRHEYIITPDHSACIYWPGLTQGDKKKLRRLAQHCTQGNLTFTMGDLDKNIHRKDTDPFKEILSHPLEKDKRHREESNPRFTPDTQLQFFSVMASYIQQWIGLIDSQARSFVCTAPLEKTLSDVKAFRKLLATLAGEDCSHNSIFNQNLSGLWHNLLDDCNSLPPEKGGSSHILGKIKFFLSQIQNFPIESEFPLGYYLAQHVGLEWLPFPCMKLLQALHEEFIKTPSRSTLHHWILLLDEILLLSAKARKTILHS